MIAKVIAHGPDRDSALKLLERALGQFWITGIPTNITFLRTVLQHPAFVKGEIDTGFIQKHVSDLFHIDETNTIAIVAIPIFILYLWTACQNANKSKNQDLDSVWHSGFSSFPARFSVQLHKKSYIAKLQLTSSTFSLTKGSPFFTSSLYERTVDEKGKYNERVVASDMTLCLGEWKVCLNTLQLDSSLESYLTLGVLPCAFRNSIDLVAFIDTKRIKATIVPPSDSLSSDTYTLFSHALQGRPISIKWLDPIETASTLAPFSSKNTTDTFDFENLYPGAIPLVCPMPSRVANLFVQEGSKVRQGDTLVVLEAMKLQHSLKAPVDGVVLKVFVVGGLKDEFVQTGKPLLLLATTIIDDSKAKK
jgi:3-methylcrotonyl-CoA carboxylase alpha subunit